MPTVTAVLTVSPEQALSALIESLQSRDVVSEVLLLGEPQVARPVSKLREVEGDLLTGRGLNRLLRRATGEYLLIIGPGGQIKFGPGAIERMLAVAEDSGAGIVYSDLRDEEGDKFVDHPLIDYRLGSIRDSFDFGSVMLLSRHAADVAVEKYGAAEETLRWGALYDLRVKVSIDSKILRIAEPLYTRLRVDRRASGEKQFDYVDPRQREYQTEMELVATEHLRRIGAYLEPKFASRNASIDASVIAASAPTASVIIPVRNRERTIKDAVNSALSQRTDFEFNVIVVDNHSSDETTRILAEMSEADERVIHLRPARTDLGIGGCWNEAIFSDYCGDCAVQLDSDDLYADQETLSKILRKFAEGDYAMVIGSYTIVDFDLREIPPGLIDHREWTRENGLNNALRISGLGAPRAFYVPLLRRLGGLPNTSYGEDYAAALRISRQYEIGRIYESIYFARRWEGNSDASLPLATANRYDAYKDSVRTVEILARQKMNRRPEEQ